MDKTRHRVTYALAGLGAGAVLMFSLPVGAAPGGSKEPAKTCKDQKATILADNNGDKVEGTPGADVILGGEGDDVIRGRGGDDLICAEQGNDSLYGGGGADKLFGQAGNDGLASGRAEKDRCIGGAGIDSVIPGHKCRHTRGVENE